MAFFEEDRLYRHETGTFEVLHIIDELGLQLHAVGVWRSSVVNNRCIRVYQQRHYGEFEEITS